MLRFEVFFDGEKDLDFSKKRVFLLTARDIEEKFMDQLNFNGNAFTGVQTDNALFELEKNSERTGRYSMKTALGERCITCISPETKLALLVILYEEQYGGARFVVDPGELRPGVFGWLNDRFDITMCIPAACLLENPPYELSELYKIEFCYKGKVIDDLVRWTLRYDNLTKFTERIACEQLFRYKEVFSFSPEGVPYGVFINNFADGERNPEPPDEFQSSFIVRAEQGQYCFRKFVTNVCVYAIFEKDGVYCGCHVPVITLPSVPDMFRDILDFFREKVGERMTAIVTCPGLAYPLKDYAENIYFGLLIDGGKRTIDLLSQNVAALLFHNALEKVDIPENIAIEEDLIWKRCGAAVDKQ